MRIKSTRPKIALFTALSIVALIMSSISFWTDYRTYTEGKIVPVVVTDFSRMHTKAIHTGFRYNESHNYVKIDYRDKYRIGDTMSMICLQKDGQSYFALPDNNPLPLYILTTTIFGVCTAIGLYYRAQL